MNVRHLAYRVASRYLLSKDRYQRETGQSLPRWKQVLNEYEASGNNFVHFSFVPKLGVYPNNKFNTPTGFYSYPLRYAQISNFATNRPYAVVFKVKPGANVLLLSQYGEEDLERDVSILREKFSEIPRAVLNDLFFRAMRDVPEDLPGKKIWYFTRNLSEELGGKFVHKWAWILWKVLGYDGVYDDRGKKVIHRDEPYQAVFFNTRVLDLKDLLQLYTPKLNEYGEVVLPPRDGGASEFVKQRSKEEKVKAKILTKDSYIGEDLSERDFSGADLSGKDFTGADFSGSNLSGATLSKANLSGATLSKANLSGATLSKANLSGAVLFKANLRAAVLPGSDLSRSDLRGADLTSANLTGANLTGAKLVAAKLVSVLDGANFTGADLTIADLSGSFLNGANFTGANLTRANFTGAGLDGANLTGAVLDGADFSNTGLIFDKS